MQKPNWYDEQSKECLICDTLLENNPVLLAEHEKEAFHKIKMVAKSYKEEVEMEERQIIKQEDVSKELGGAMSLGDIFVKSGLFPDLKSQAQAVVKILAGRELGLSPLQSITDIYMVNGKVALQSKLIASLIKKSGKYDYHIDKLDEQECIISFFQLNGEKVKMGESIFTIKDAAKAGIVNKDSWKAYPKNMLFSRAISNGGRLYCADVITAYTPEEIEEIKIIPIEKLEVTQ